MERYPKDIDTLPVSPWDQGTVQRKGYRKPMDDPVPGQVPIPVQSK